MKKGQISEGYVENIQFPNKGIVTIEGQRIIIKNALPGQKIRFMLTKKRSGTCEGKLLEVLEQSPSEKKSGVCPHFGSCGGCLYQSLPYEEQLRIKESQVKELLDSAVCQPYEWEGILGSPRPEAYRNKMEFSFGDEIKDGPLALGMHKRGSFHDIVTVTECRIVDEDFRKILSTVLGFFQQKQVPFYRKLQHTGVLRHLLVRKAVKTGQILVALVASTQQDLSREMEELCRILQELPLDGEIVGILKIDNDSLADVVQSDRTHICFGRGYIEEELLGLRFQISPFSFFQTNSLGAEVLYEKARSYVGETKDKLIFDLYSGTGTIAQLMAPVAKKVIGVEIVEEAVEAARRNAEANGLDNCEFIAGDVLKVVDEIDDRPDLIVLDPPRDGIHPKALEKIIGYGVENLVYISCKPTSLVRDLGRLQECGYRVVKGCCVDMFPGTGNVETVVLLTKEAPKKGNFIGEVSGEKRDIDTAFGIQQKVLEEINTLAEKYKIDKVILFGSRARGDYKEVSDIDLAVSGGDVNEFTLAVDAETSTLLEYDVVNLDGSVQEELRKSIEREGKMLYEKI